MGQIYDTIKAYFDEDDWTYTELDERPVLRMACRSDNGSWVCFAQAREEMNQFVFYSVLEQNVPEDRRLAVAEFLTRANYNMIIGNFELDFSDGEVRYKSAVDVEDVGITTNTVRNVVRPNLMTFDRYLRGVISVAFGNVDPLAAIDQSEGNSSEAASDEPAMFAPFADEPGDA